MIISKPVISYEISNKLQSLLQIRDQLHAIAQSTRGLDHGEGESQQIQRSETETQGTSEMTKGTKIATGLAGAGTLLLASGVAAPIGLAIGATGVLAMLLTGMKHKKRINVTNNIRNYWKRAALEQFHFIRTAVWTCYGA